MAPRMFAYSLSGFFGSLARFRVEAAILLAVRATVVLSGGLVFALACGDAGLSAGSGSFAGSGGQASGATFSSGSSHGLSGLASGASVGTGGSASGASVGTAGSASGSSVGTSGSVGSTAETGSGGLPTVGGIFQQPEPWTEDVTGLPKDARSDAIIAALATMGGWGNGNQFQIDFSIPVFFGDTTTPRQTISAQAGSQYCYGGPDCDAVPMQMPLPANGNTEGSASYTCDTTGTTAGQGDCHVLVVEKDQNKLYELYNSTRTATGFTALGAFIWDLTKAYPKNLRGDQCTSADAAGFPMAALLPTADEVAAGAVKHALRFILPNDRMRPRAYVHPASHAGSPKGPNSNAPPYGVRFRLKAAFDETPFSAGAKVILRALKTYGMLLSDGGNIALTFADDRTTTAKWAAQGITSRTFAAIGVNSFEVVDYSPEVPLTDNCMRNP